MIDILMPTIAQGLLWAIMALGVYITFRVLDIADLTVEGSFPLGAAVAAAMLSEGYSVSAAFACAAVAGMLAGVATGFLHTKLKIPALLAGILTMIALYSVNLRVMGKANLSLLRIDTIFTEMQALTAAASTVGGKYLSECTLYVTVEPCIMCAGAIGWSQLSTIVYGAPDEKRGYSRFAPQAFHPKAVVKKGVLEEECAAEMKRFFQEKRR